jgi:putative sugar O-methyltransferase
MANVSKQWEKLTQEQFQHVDDELLATFRAPGSKNKFVAWDPFERASRYFKFLLFNTASKQSAEFFDAYRKLEHRELGDPLTVKYAGCDVDADYLAAVEEWEFLSRSRALDGTRTVVEIGAGFGRTCHTLLTLGASIEKYVIIDLAPMLRLSQAYLERVRPGANVHFVSSEDHAQIDALRPDLVINIDSFQEMPPTVIDFYMEHVVRNGRRFYCKNPVGKYLPGSIGQPDLTPAQLMDVFKIGYCQEVIDIFDEQSLQAARQAFLKAYRPVAASGDAAYTLAADKVMDLFPYFHHALYTR